MLLLTFDRIQISVRVLTKIVLPRSARSLRISSNACLGLLEQIQSRLLTSKGEDVAFSGPTYFPTLDRTREPFSESSWMLESSHKKTGEKSK
jgi:hypothetical protein